MVSCIQWYSTNVGHHDDEQENMFVETAIPSPAMFFPRSGMNPQIDIITLGVSDLDQSIEFYRDGLGFNIEMEAENYARFIMGDIRLALFPRELLAHDGHVSPEGGGFSGITLAQIVESEDDIQEVLEEAEAAGGHITKPLQKAEEFDGFSGYFSDPDGYLWEIAAFA